MYHTGNCGECGKQITISEEEVCPYCGADFSCLMNIQSNDESNDHYEQGSQSTELDEFTKELLDN